MTQKVTIGSQHADERGVITYNNDFDVSIVKRIYFIENRDIEFIRGWQGHKIVQRWFTVVRGSFLLKLIKIDDWKCPTTTLEQEIFTLSFENMAVLHVPQGYVTSIQSLEENSKLMAMADYLMGEIQDEYRFAVHYFNRGMRKEPSKKTKAPSKKAKEPRQK